MKIKSPKDYIIFPLDVPTFTSAKTYIETLADSVGMFKVGLELFIRSGPDIIRHIRQSGPAGVFLDLKLHDIPVTVSRAMAGIADLDVTFATVHCGENPEMLAAAVAGGGGKVGVLGVTVLTSVSGSDLASAGYSETYHADLSRLVLKRATDAQKAGCAGVVCSGREVAMLKARLGNDFIAVTPGIRPGWEAGGDDQKRVSTPAEAIARGSDYLVIGRPIRDADDPGKAAERIAAEIAEADKCRVTKVS